MHRLTSLAFILTLLLSWTALARARYIPPFDLDYCVGEAKVIVQGKLDPQGSVTVAEVMRKHGPLPSNLKLYAGESEYEYMRRIIG